MVGKAPNFGLFFVIFSDSTKTQQKRKKKCVRNQTNCGDCLLIGDSQVAGFAIPLLTMLQRKAKIDQYLQISISSGRKCFSQVYTLSLLISLSKFLSISLDLVSSFNQSSLHFLYSAFLGAGSFHMPIPLILRKPKTAQLSPGICVNNI